MKKTLLVIVVAAMAGCSSPKQESETQTETPAQESAPEEAYHDAASLKVELDNGKRWVANQETTQGITEMNILVATLPSEPSESDYQKLRTGLEEKLNFIFNECTMQGAAHDQLHNYLIPLKDLIQQCGSGTPEENKAVVEKLKLHLTAYANYFE